MSKRCDALHRRRPNIRAFLDVSNGHLSPETWAWLDAQTTDEAVRDPDNKVGTELLGGRTRYGWLVYAHEHATEPVPADLVAVMRLARGLGCEYVLFDCDAPPTPDLPLLHPGFQDGAAAA
jgi:hypothetical protein